MLGATGLLLVLALGASTLYRPVAAPDFAAGRDERQKVVTEAVSGIRAWPGITYRGSVTLLGGGTVDADITVAGDGTLRGSLSRVQGGRAEVVVARGAVLVRGDRAWWSSRSTQDAALVADRWVKDPIGGASDTELVRSFPTRDELIAKLERAPAASWYREEPRTIDGVDGRALVSFGDSVVVDEATTPPRLLAWASTLGASSGDGLRLRAATPEALTAASEGVGMVETTPTDADVRAGRVGVKLERLGGTATCDPGTCTFRVQVTNHDAVRVAGQVAFVVVDRPAGEAPFLAEPGQTVTVTHTAPRPAGLVTQGTFPWKARLLLARPS